ncbi:hypothetical protein Peur_020498 [Populus x canadensis]
MERENFNHLNPNNGQFVKKFQALHEGVKSPGNTNGSNCLVSNLESLLAQLLKHLYLNYTVSRNNHSTFHVVDLWCPGKEKRVYISVMEKDVDELELLSAFKPKAKLERMKPYCWQETRDRHKRRRRRRTVCVQKKQRKQKQ